MDTKLKEHNARLHERMLVVAWLKSNAKAIAGSPEARWFRTVAREILAGRHAQ